MSRIGQDGFEMGVPFQMTNPTNHAYLGSMWVCRSSGINFSGGRVTSPVNTGAYSLRARSYSSSGSGWLYYRWKFPGKKTEHFGRAEFAHTDIQASVATAIGIMDAGENVFATIATDGGDLVFYVGGVEVGRVAGAVSVVEVFNRVEWRYVVDDISGVFEAKINGNNLFSYTGDTQGALDGDGVYYVSLGLSGAALRSSWSPVKSHYFDDFAINDTTGTVNNSWCGKGSILLLKPKGVGNYSQFTPSNNTYDNWEMVDEVPHDSDTTYVSSEVAEHIDTYEMEELVADKGIDPEDLVVKAVQVCLTGRYEGVDAHLAPMLRSGTTDHEGDQMTMASSYYRLFDEVFGINPFTSAAWAHAEVDALEAGVKHKAHVE